MSTSFNNALATPQYNMIRNNHQYAGDRLLYLFKNTVVFAGQINSDLTTPQTWAEFDFTNTTGSYLDVHEGMVLYIGTTNDLFAAARSGFYGRTRLVPDATTFYCNESSEDFDVGDYFWVIDRYDIQYKLSRPTPLTNVELVDYDIPYQGLPPRIVGLQAGYMAYVDPLTGKLRLGFDMSASEAAESGETIASYVYAFPSATLAAGSLSGPICIMDFDPGEQYGGAGVIDTAGLNLDRRFGIVALDDDTYPPDTGYTNGSVGGTLDQGYTLTIPAFKDVDTVLYNSYAIAIRANEQYGGTVQTLYGGGSAAVTNKVLTSQTATLTAAGHPYQAGQTVIVADVGTEFDGTFVITATTATTFSYHSAQANVASTGCSGLSVVNPPKPDFIGWLNRESDPLAGDLTYSVKTGAEFVFTGVAPRLGRLTAQLLAMVLSASGTRWGDIAALTPWRAIWHFLSRYTTAALLCDVTFSDTTDQFQFPDISTEGQDALGAIRWIGAMINAIPEFAPWGAIAVNRDVNYLSQAERNLTTVVANFTDADFIEAPRSIDPNQSVGKVDTDAAVYNTANSQVTVFTARAPGHAQGEASGSESLPGQALAASPDMVAALNEARQRVTQKFEVANLQEFLDVRFKAGWVGIHLISSRSQVYTVTLSDVGGPNGVNRVEYDTATLWTLESIAIENDAEHGRLIPHGKLRRVADIGGPGDNTTQNIPAPNSVVDPLPDLGFPAFNFELPEVTLPDIGLELSQINPIALLPPKGKVATFNGGELLVWNTTQIFYEKNFIALKKPISVDITPSNLPSGYNVVQCVVDPSFTYSLIPAYVLITNNTDSQVGYCTNIAQPGAAALWTFGASFNGAYTVIRATATPGGILVYAASISPAGGAWSQDLDFTTQDWGFAQDDPRPAGIWEAGVGWRTEINATTLFKPLGAWGKRITQTYLSAIQIHYSVPGPGGAVGGTRRMDLYKNSTGTVWGGGFTGTLVASLNLNTGDGTFTDTLTVNDDVDYIWVIIDTNNTFVSSNNVNDDMVVTGPTNNPFVGVGTVVRYSSDYGVMIGSEIAVGAALAGVVGGFDTQRSGSVSYAGYSGAVARATTLGGSYSPWYSPASGDPVCVIQPHFRRNSTTKNTSVSNPDALVATTTGKLYWVNGITITPTDISPPGVTTFDSPNCVTVSYGHHIACYGSVSGTLHLFTSTDGGVSWTDRGARTSPTFIRCRRNDTRASVSGTNKGQLFMMDNGDAYYSSVWDSTGPYIRTMPAAMTGLETIF